MVVATGFRPKQQDITHFLRKSFPQAIGKRVYNSLFL